MNTSENTIVVSAYGIEANGRKHPNMKLQTRVNDVEQFRLDFGNYLRLKHRCNNVKFCFLTSPPTGEIEVQP